MRIPAHAAGNRLRRALFEKAQDVLLGLFHVVLRVGMRLHCRRDLRGKVSGRNDPSVGEAEHISGGLRQQLHDRGAKFRQHEGREKADM